MGFRMSDKEMVISLIESNLEDDNTFSRIGKGYAIIGIIENKEKEEYDDFDFGSVEMKVINKGYLNTLLTNNIKLEGIYNLTPYISIED